MNRKLFLNPSFATTVALSLLSLAPSSPQAEPSQHGPAVFHATVSIRGGLNFTGAYDSPPMPQSCAELAKGGTGLDGLKQPMFNVPIPPPSPGGNPGFVGNGHTFTTDASAFKYHGPGVYSGAQLAATQVDADPPPGSQEKGIFAFSEAIGVLTVNPDASGSFNFGPAQDPSSVLISGTVTWTCSSDR